MVKQEIMETNGTELALIESPRFPALPIFDEQLDSYLAKTDGLRCDSREEFDANKKLASEGVTFNGQIVEAFKPRKQAFDSAKQPTLDAERELLTKVSVRVKEIDAVNVAWYKEQKRLAEVEAERKRQEEIARREALRQAEIKRQEEERKAEVERRTAERATELLRIEAQKAKDAEIAELWGEAVAEDAPIELPPIVEPPPVIVPEIVAPRPVKADLGFAGRKGSRTKQVLKHKIIDPEAINEKYKSADPMKIKARIANYVNLVKEPSEEQISKLAEEIGKGIELFWE